MSFSPVSARLFDGESPVAEEVEVRVGRTFILVHDRTGRERGRFLTGRARLEAHGRSGGRLTFRGDDELLLELTADEVEALARSLRVNGRFPALTVAALGAAVIAAAAGLWFSTPWLAGVVAEQVPHAWEAELGAGIGSRFSRHACDAPEAKAALDAMLERIGRPESYPIEPRIHLLPVDDVNAFALPGGVIGVTRGLVRKAEDPAEVAGVLAHEVAHLTERHAIRRLVRMSMLTFLWAVSFGDYTGLLVLDPTTLFSIATLEFSRADEAEADRIGTAALVEAGVDAAAFARFFEKLEEEEGTDGIFGSRLLRSHPPSHDRAQATRAAAAAQGPLGPPVLDEAAWQALKAACADQPALSMAQLLSAW